MNSSPEEALFQLALSKPAEKRDAFLDVLCEGDPALRQRLEALLAAHEQPATELASAGCRRDEFHESQASPSRSQGLTELSPPRDEAVGQTLGRYKLLDQIGEGGCGVVYVAELLRPPQSLPIVNNTHSPYKPWNAIQQRATRSISSQPSGSHWRLSWRGNQPGRHR